MPTAADLVTDLPADFEVFGQAVDTRLKALQPGTTNGDIAYSTATANTSARLAIGTTGQVLTVAGGVPTWATSDDANAIQNAIVDAKGDLIAASANDTPARLAVGADGSTLVADSSAATGLKWQGAYTSYTPTFTNLTIGNGSMSAKYLQVGKLVYVFIQFVMGSTSSMGTDPFFTFPITADGSPQGPLGNYYIQDYGVSEYTGTFLYRSNTTAALRIVAVNGIYAGGPNPLSATVPFTWGTNDYLEGTFIYGAA